PAVADVHPHVARAGVEEDQITGAQLRPGDRPALGDLVVGGAFQRHPRLSVGPLYESGAVEGVRAGRPPAVGGSDLALSVAQRLLRGAAAAPVTAPAASNVLFFLRGVRSRVHAVRGTRDRGGGRDADRGGQRQRGEGRGGPADEARGVLSL